MTPELLEELVAKGDQQGIANAAQALTEAERKKLAPTTEKLFKVLEKTRAFSSTKELLERLKGLASFTRTAGSDNQRGTAMLAVLAFCGLTVARRVSWHGNMSQGGEIVFKILSDRRPAWIDAWVEAKLGERSQGIRWDLLHKLIQHGICAKPSSDGYTLLFARDFPARTHSKELFIPLSEKLRQDPELLGDEIWRLFAVETEAFTLDFTEQHSVYAPKGYEGWSTALYNLASQGDIDRQRLLTACLDGLFTGFKNTVLSGFVKLHERLAPTAEERVARQRIYLDLLSNPAAHVVTFALDALKAVAKAGQLDGEAFIACAAPAIASRTKGHPKAAIALLEGIVKRTADLREPAALLLIEALAHESPEVQERAIDLVEKWSVTGEASLAAALAGRIEDLTASQRPRVEALLQRLGACPSAEPPQASQQEGATSDKDSLQRAAALSPEIRRIAGVDDAAAALEQGTVPPLRFALFDAPVLSSCDAIVPITDLEELIEAVGHAVEKVDSADELERILDGMSRLCAMRPADFERRTEPLTKRISDLVRRHSDQARQGLLAIFVVGATHEVLMAWLGSQHPVEQKRHPLRFPYAPQMFLHARLHEIAKRVARRTAFPLLAAPTHTGGWIDPRVFVERLLAAKDLKICEHRYDLMQALIRLAPDHRAEALARAAAIEGSLGRLVRWALGAPEAPGNEEKQEAMGGAVGRLVRRALGGKVASGAERVDASLWLAAGRARAPHARIQELAEWKIEDPGPDGIEPARYAWQREPEKEARIPGVLTSINGMPCLQHYPRLREVARPGDWPTAALHDCESRFFGVMLGAPMFVEWLAMLWPQNVDGFLASGVRVLAFNVNAAASTFSPNCSYLRPLMHPDRTWNESARLLLGLALAGRDTDARSHAIEALADAIADGRAHAQELGATLAMLTPEPAIKLGRIAEALQEVARMSDLHAYVVAQILACWLKAQEELPRDAHHMLEPLLELLTRCGIGLVEEARKPLAAVKGSGKAAKLAKRLLDLAPPEHTQRVKAFALELLRGRLERAERWQAAR